MKYRLTHHNTQINKEIKEKIHIVSLSDIHGRLKSTYIPECDVVTISGDFSPLQIDRKTTYNGPLCTWIINKFIPWLLSLPCKQVIFIPGNHDFITEQPWFEEWFVNKLHAMDEYYLGANDGVQPCPSKKIVYLCYESYTYMGYKFYGCPSTDMSNWAWSSGNDYTKYLFPTDTDILLVHQAPNWSLLGTSHFPDGTTANFGSLSLLNALYENRDNLPKLLLCGHIHSGNHIPIIYDLEGNDKKTHSCMMVNVSTKDEDYVEYFYARNFILEPFENNIRIETWVSPAKGSREIDEYNRRESFLI